MRYLWVFFGLILYSIMTAACFPYDQQNQIKLQEARKGLDPTIEQVRQFQGFEVVTVKYYELYDDEHGPGPTCYYARSYLLIGTSLSLPEAVTVYAQDLQSLGWVLRDLGQYQDSKVLNRGANERAVVESGEPGPELKSAADYGQLRKMYRSLIYVNIDYVLPAAQGC